MSCPPEATWRAYLDGRLAPEPIRQAEAHLVGCERCRAQVLALTAAPASAAPAEPLAEPAADPPPSRGVRVLLVAGGLAGLALVGALIDEAFFAGSDALDPNALIGVARDLIFRLQSRVPGLFTLTVGLAATASVSALATLAVTWILRRLDRRLALWMMLALPLGAPAAEAVELSSEERYVLPAGETLAHTLFASGEEITLDGEVAGDAFLTAERVVVRGRIVGSLYAWAEEIELEGEVLGDVWIGAQRIELAGRVAGSGHAAADRLDVTAGAEIARDLWLVAERASLAGDTGRDVWAIAERIELSGRIERDLEVHARELALAAGAHVGRDLELELPEEVEPELAPEARVAGEVRRRAPGGHEPGALSELRAPSFWLLLLLRIVAAFVFGLGLRLLWPSLFALEPRDAGEWLRTGGVGLIAAFAAPLALLGLAVTVVALPLAAAGFFAWVVALYAAGVVVAVRLGAALLGAPGADLRRFAAVLALGTALLGIALQLPFFGALIRIGTLAVGLGLTVRALLALRRSAVQPA